MSTLFRLIKMIKSIVFALIYFVLSWCVLADDELGLQSQNNEATSLDDKYGTSVALIQSRNIAIGKALVVFSFEGLPRSWVPISFALIDEDFDGIIPLRSIMNSEIIGHVSNGSVHDMDGFKSCSFGNVVLLDESDIVFDGALVVEELPAWAALPELGLIKEKASPISCLKLLQSSSG